ncbi:MULTISPECIES: GyrI-like domain-containing protein [unclassified Enterococcus]|uniref:GyrI-like domain-containing protein n=1 Tax=unclassified Enterococcus TaxID=2608891 RepID=UPI0013EC33B4|nr:MULTISPECIES: GyrI-like domain-containing protein [unclassified Enterococcus]
MEKIFNWKKSESGYFLKKQPHILEIPSQKFFCITGIGDPNKEEFQRKVASLYAWSYAIRMAPKKGWDIPNYFPYVVYPLEGEWGIQKKYLKEKKPLKEHYAYRIMIKQPKFVTKEIAKEALIRIKKKIPEDLVEALTFMTIDEGTVAQVLHVGSYDDEPKTFQLLESFVTEKGYKRVTKEHKEIYLSNPERTVPEKLKTILRVKVVKES